MKKKQKPDTTASVFIYPINEENEPMEDWFWDAEIVHGVGTITKSVFGSNPACFTSLQAAFNWAYGWLTENGYDASNIEFEMNDKSHKGIHKK